MGTRDGGKGGIRTRDRASPIPDFESGAFDHSATFPLTFPPGVVRGGKGRHSTRIPKEPA